MEGERSVLKYTHLPLTAQVQAKEKLVYLNALFLSFSPALWYCPVDEKEKFCYWFR